MYFEKIKKTIYLYVSFIHFIEKIFDPVIMFGVMNHDKSHVSCSDKSTDVPLIKLINNFQMHVICFPDVLIDKVQGGVSDELCQMLMIFFLIIDKKFFLNCYYLHTNYSFNLLLHLCWDC